MTEPTLRHDCQDGCLRDAGEHVPRFRVLMERAVEQVRRDGLISLGRRAAAFLGRRVSLSRWTKAASSTRAVAPASAVLKLQKGEWVVVKPRDEIERTFDGMSRTRGLGFMPSMFEHCGKQFRVYKRAETIVLEGTGQTRRLKDTVLLEGSICDGEGFVCDRSCFYFWKEDWLKRP